ncbi:MAG: BlaI/MecI/CopY family transcriptional regulator [Owenweeksia sp.]|nr:BlaI/MecI/CopY family transcriptional regulator [Owenweeksia sp.]
MKELTRAEEEVMQVLWQLEKAFVKEIIAEMPAPKPAYNTVSTIVRILQDKGLVSHERLGKSHRYYPLISKESYSKHKMENLVSGYFEGSLSKMVSFFVHKKKLSTKELEEILQIIEKEKK